MPRKINLYRRLRSRMVQLDIDQHYLGDCIRMKASSVSSRLTGKVPWSIEECYEVCRVLEIPLTEIPLYWPPNGVEKDQNKGRKTA